MRCAHHRAPFKIADRAARLTDSENTLVWEPNLAVAANEDHKGHYALFAGFISAARGEKVAAPTAADGASAMRPMENALCG